MLVKTRNAPAMPERSLFITYSRLGHNPNRQQRAIHQRIAICIPAGTKVLSTE